MLRPLFALLLSLPLMAAAAGYPDKPIRFIVPFPPGGGVDNFARPLALRLSEQLGQQVLIENRGGAGGVIGSAVAAKAAPDGYTFLVSTDTSVYLTTLVVKNASYDPIKDLTPVISAAITPTVFVSHPSLEGVKTMKDLIELAKKSEKPIPYVTAGVGSLHHLTGESLALRSDAKLLHVAYKGGAPAMTALLGGEVKVGILILSAVAPHIKTGRLRVLATIENHRSKLYPDIPTIAESALPGFAMPDTALAVWGPAGLAQDIAERMNSEVQKAMQAPSVRAAMEKGGYEAKPTSAKEFRDQAARSYAAYKRMVSEVNLANH